MDIRGSNSHRNPNDQTEKRQPQPLGKIPFGRWYKTRITRHPKQSQYDVEITDLEPEQTASRPTLQSRKPCFNFLSPLSKRHQFDALDNFPKRNRRKANFMIMIMDVEPCHHLLVGMEKSSFGRFMDSPGSPPVRRDCSALGAMQTIFTNVSVPDILNGS